MSGSEEQLSPCSERETGVTAHGVHVLSKLSLGEDHTLHQIPAERSKRYPIRQTEANFTDKRWGFPKKKKKKKVGSHPIHFNLALCKGFPLFV